jgi:uncharacterized protein YidB (DUF937 family)
LFTKRLEQSEHPAEEADMGMLDDILNSMQDSGGTGRPGTQPAPGGDGMSPIAKALIGLIAGYAIKNMSGMGGGSPAQPGGSPSQGQGGGLGDVLGSILGGGAMPGRSGPSGGMGGGGGGLGDVLGGLFGGGAAAGSAINGRLGDLLKQFQQKGLGDEASSWVGSGPNKAISPRDLESALGGDTLNSLSQHTGMGRAALLDGLSQQLPHFVDQLTPNGRLPTKEEAGRML